MWLKNLAEIVESQYNVGKESLNHIVLFVRYKGTYVVNKLQFDVKSELFNTFGMLCDF